MKKYLPILLMVLFTGLTLAGFVRMATSQAPVDQPLVLASVSPAEVEAGRPFELSLEGEGVDEDVRISLALDVGNLWSVVGYMDTWAPLQDIALSGDLAVIANNYRGLLIADISDADRPVVVSSLPLPGRPFSVTLGEEIAYLALARDGIATVNFSSAEEPTLLQHLPVPGVAWEIGLGTDFLCVAAGIGGLQVFDRQVGAGMTPLAALQLEGRAFGVDVQRDVAFVAAMEEGLVTVDLSTPGKPQVLSRFPLPAPVGAVTVQGTVAYVTDRRGALHILDVADRIHPRLLSTTTLSGRLSKPLYHDGLLLVPGTTTGLQMLDVRSPETPLLLGSIMFKNVRSIAVRGDRAYVAHSGRNWPGGKQGVYVVDLGRVAPVQVKGSYSSQGEARRMSIAEGVGYLADGRMGLKILDLTRPGGPVKQGTLDAEGGNLVDVSVVEGIAYMADDRLGLVIADVSDPALPRLLSRTQTFGAARAVVVEDGLAYLLCGDLGQNSMKRNVRGVQILDVGDPSAPRLVGEIETGGASSLVVQGKVGFLAGSRAGLLCLDLQDPTRPEIVGKASIPWPEGQFSSAKDLALKDDVLYVAYGIGGLFALDVRSPLKPVIIGHLPADGGIYGVDLQGDRAYLSGSRNGVIVVDISDPRRLGETGHLEVPVFSRKVIVRGDDIFIPNQYQGVLVAPKPLEGELVAVEGGRVSARFAGLHLPGRYSLYLHRGGEEAELVGGLLVTGPGL